MMFSFNNSTFPCAKTSTGEAYWASFDDKSFSRGPRFKVYSGLMNGKGCRSGNKCVVKVFRRCVGTESMCRCEDKKCQKAQKLAREFNGTKQIKDTKVKFAKLYWAEMDEISTFKQLFFSGRRKLCHEDCVLFEEDLRFDDERANTCRELTKFMDCHGKNRGCVAKDLDAFAHFTYHRSNGSLVICDLHGVQDDTGFSLKTPTIHSRKQEYGDSDKGEKGIIDVFTNHICNQFCKNMIKPLNAQNNFPASNINLIPVGRHSDTLSSGGRTICPEEEQRHSQDICNNNDISLEHQDSLDSHRSRLDDHNMQRKQSTSSSRCISSMSAYLEPSAPLAEDCDETMFYPPSPPAYNEISVANWLLQEQARNNFITRGHGEPLWRPADPRIFASRVSVDSGRGRSISVSNESSTVDVNENTHGQCTGICAGCSRNINQHCDQEQQGSFFFDGPLYSPVASFLPQTMYNFTDNSAMTCNNGNTRFQRNPFFSQNPAPFLTGNHPVLESPPSYKDSVMEAS